ncbi:hypothetical protein CL657_04295 [bacterium]|nr:hypothetical protein [bacterium]
MTEFGPIKFLIESFMLPFLSFSYETIIPNYGISIILLTVIIKIIFYPLMNKQYTSMKKMQEIAPKMTELRQKFKSDPHKMQQEVMKLYKDHNVSPLQGCLPMLLQIPFFIAIYATIISDQFSSLLKAPGINQGLFSFWLSDLTVADSTYILPIILAVFTFYSQKMMMVDPKQKQLLYLSPIMILIFGLQLPSGVLLYWSTSTVISTIQQFLITKPSSPNILNVIPKKAH